MSLQKAGRHIRPGTQNQISNELVEQFGYHRKAGSREAKLDVPVAISKTNGMNLRQFVKYWLWRDTTHRGEFAAMRRLMTPDFPRIVVDVGANNGFYGSNSFPFVARGWRAILIEPHPKVFAQLVKLHQGKPNVTCLNLACSNEPGTLPLFVGLDGEAPSTSTLSTDPELLKARSQQTIPVKVVTLTSVLEAQQAPADIGLLTVDVEGMDYEVLLGLDFARFRPRLIITEDYLPKEVKKAEWLVSNGYRLALNIARNTLWQSVR